jgi:hypothetical protein
MIRFKHVVAALVALAALTGCGGKGSEANPPAGGLQLTPGDGTVTVTWAADPAIDYWLFISSDSRLTTENFTSLTDIHIVRSATSPYMVCGNIDGRPLYFAMNGRTGNGPGGTGTATVAAPSLAAGTTWSRGTAPAVDFNGIGFAAITGCAINALPTGLFMAVGTGGAIATSTDGVTFTAQATPSGFTTDLFGVAGFAASPNVPTAPGLKLVAVGAGGATLLSADGVTWTQSVAFNASSPTLRSVAIFAGVFVAVGDGGAAQTSTDGITWTAHAAGPTANLQGVWCETLAPSPTFPFAPRCIAVGDNGTIVLSFDGGATWQVQAVAGTPALKKVMFGNFNNNVGSPGTQLNTWVAVGDAGSVLYSVDGGATWAATTVAGAGNFVGVAYITRFVAVDSAGNTFASVDGQTWSGPIATGATAQRAMVGTGIGYATIGAGGATSSSH